MDTERYHIAYLRSIGTSDQEIFERYLSKLTSDILDVLIESGFTSEHITSEMLNKTVLYDRESMLRVFAIMKNANNPHIENFGKACGIFRFADIGKIYLGEMAHPLKLVVDHDPNFKEYLSPYFKHVNDGCLEYIYQIALYINNYPVADFLYDSFPNLFKYRKSVFLLDEFVIDLKTVPLKHFLCVKREKVNQYFLNIIYKYDRVDILEALYANNEPLFDEDIILDMSVKSYRFIRSKITPSDKLYCSIIYGSGHILSDELLADEHFVERIKSNVIAFLGAASNSVYLSIVDYIIKNYRAQIIDIISKGDLLKELSLITDQLCTKNESDKLIISLYRWLIFHDFPREILIPDLMGNHALYFRSIPLIDFHPKYITMCKIDGIDYNPQYQQIFLLRKRKAGIREWAQRMITMIVMYSDGYFRVRFSYYQRFFDLVAQLPLAMQSIIAFRYAWLPNCETILLRDSDFYRELAGQ